jgi:protein-S-isoprenylcysteine O-methyltransferase Ste14
MIKRSAALGTAIFFFVAPGTVAGLIPWWICRWELGPPFFGFKGCRYLGLLLIAAGLLGLVDCFVRFAVKGRGTPAPVMPTESLVVSGLYRYVRNPMYVAVFCVIVGQGLFFANVAVLAYALLVWLAFHLFVRLYEEPRLSAVYGAQYNAFLANVPRWFPRRTPWKHAETPQG